MAFPVIAATNTSSHTSNTTSHTINLPSGIVSGNLLIVFFTCGPPNNGDVTITWPAGWNILSETFLAGSLGHKQSTYYRRADGSEGSTITITTSALRVSAHGSYRITGHHATRNPEAGVAATGSSTSANPPSLNPSAWGTEDTLWAAFGSAESGAAQFSGFPSGYTLNQLSVSGNNVQLGAAAKQSRVESEDPGTFTNPNAPWIAQTFAVPPAPDDTGTRTHPVQQAARIFPNPPAERTFPKVPTLV